MRWIAAVVALWSASTAAALAGDAPAKAPLKTLPAKFSYMIGQEMAGIFQKMQVDVDHDALVRGLTEGLKGKDPIFTPEEMMGIFRSAQEQCARKNEEFLAANKKKEGVVTTDSGLQYTVLEEGDGPKPKATDRVRVHYVGTLIDGSEFDSSYKRGRPATFAVNGVIPGWTEALQLMNVGSKLRLFIPAKIGYGDQGAGPKIGPGAALVFEVKLIKIEE